MSHFVLLLKSIQDQVIYKEQAFGFLRFADEAVWDQELIVLVSGGEPLQPIEFFKVSFLHT